MANKTRIEFEGFENVIAKLTKLEGNIRETTDKALKETHKIVTQKASKEIERHYLTGQTEKSIYNDANIDWTGTLASVSVGFSIRQGGIASIFLMYGTPRMKKDQKLYNAFWGKKTKEEIIKKQEEIFYEEIRRLDG